MKDLNFDILDDLTPVDELDDDSEEFDNRPASYGFWSSLGDGECEMFIELLKDEETKKACYDAINVLSKLENVVEDYIIWM